MAAPPDPNKPAQPELYQVIGSVLRDVAQARFMSDRYSRQISYQYERDSLLRTFPVPRVEIEEVEFDLHFGIVNVSEDPSRRTSKNAAISSLYDEYSLSIVRLGLLPIRRALEARVAQIQAEALKAGEPATDEEKAAQQARTAQLRAADQLERTFLSDENRDRLRGRLLRFFNEESDKWFDDKGNLAPPRPDPPEESAQAPPAPQSPAPATEAEKEIRKRLAKFKKSLITDKDLLAAQQALALGDTLQKAIDEADERVRKEVADMLTDINAVKGRYPDYKVEIDVSPEGLRTHPAVSHVRVRSAVKNYKWAKVEVDSADMRNVRNLTQE